MTVYGRSMNRLTNRITNPNLWEHQIQIPWRAVPNLCGLVAVLNPSYLPQEMPQPSIRDPTPKRTEINPVYGIRSTVKMEGKKLLEKIPRISLELKDEPKRKEVPPHHTSSHPLETIHIAKNGPERSSSTWYKEASSPKIHRKMEVRYIYLSFKFYVQILPQYTTKSVCQQPTPLSQVKERLQEPQLFMNQHPLQLASTISTQDYTMKASSEDSKINQKKKVNRIYLLF